MPTDRREQLNPFHSNEYAQKSLREVKKKCFLQLIIREEEQSVGIRNLR